MNPFTKKPTTFKPAPGTAIFTTASGACSITFQDGSLSAVVTDEEAMAFIEQIAAAFEATITDINE